MSKKSTNPHATLKHDLLISIGKELESIDDSRFIYACLDLLPQWQLLSDNYYLVNIASYSQWANLPYPQAYLELKSLADKHTRYRIKVAIQGSTVWDTSLIYDYIYNDESKFIQVKFNTKLLPLISGEMTKGEFHRYDNRMAAVSSNKHLLLSEFLQKQLWRVSLKNDLVIQTIELREACNCTELYKEYRDFNKRVIQPTLTNMGSILGVYLMVTGNKYRVILSRVGSDQSKARVSKLEKEVRAKVEAEVKPRPKPRFDVPGLDVGLEAGLDVG